MRKTLSLMTALLFTASVSAQSVQMDVFGADNKFQKTTIANVLQQPNPSKIILDENEKIMGFYTSDELDVKNGLGMPNNPGNYLIGSIFPLDITNLFATGEITKARIGLCGDVGVSKFRIYTISNNMVSADPIAEATMQETKSGWNEVTFAKPVTIEEGVTYLFAYNYEQKTNEYPLAIDYSYNAENACPTGFMMLEESNWVSMGTKYGNLCIQLVVKGGNFIDDDIELSNLVTEKSLYKKGEEMNFQFQIRSIGNNIPENYKVKATINGQEINLKLPQKLTDSKQFVTGTYSTTDQSAGKYELKIDVTEINGVKPTENTSNDNLAIDYNVYENTLSRQKQIVEQFTSQYCTFCPNGGKFLAALKEERKNDDLVILSIHADMGYNAKDIYTTQDGNQVLNAIGCIGFPSAAFNRYMVADPNINPQGVLTVSLGYPNPSQYAPSFNKQVIDASVAAIPALAMVDINTTYDESTRELSINVSGDVVPEFRSILGDEALLTVCLSEDGLIAEQMDNGVWKTEYNHNNVYRKAVTKPLGDALVWTNDTKYENTYKVTLKKDWNPANMNVVAFISKGLDQIYTFNDAGIFNGNMAKVGSTSGISSTAVNKADLKEVARFTIDGRRVSAPVKGVNLIKMSDGSIVKEFVK